MVQKYHFGPPSHLDTTQWISHKLEKLHTKQNTKVRLYHMPHTQHQKF